MRTQFYVPGPSYLYIGVRDPATLAVTSYQFLGFNENETQLSLMGAYEEVHADYGGPTVPVDSQFMGEYGFVAATLSRYNEEVLRDVQVRAGQLLVDNTLNTGYAMTPGVPGSLMVTEGWAYPLVIKSGYVGLKAAAARLPAGYTFWNAMLADEFTFPLSTRVKRPRCMWKCLPQWDECSGKYALYSPTVPSSLPNCNTG